MSEVLRSAWITTGAKSAEFERKFCEFAGCEHAVALSSATGGHARGSGSHEHRRGRRGDHAVHDLGLHRELDCIGRCQAGVRGRGKRHADGLLRGHRRKNHGTYPVDRPRAFRRGARRHRADQKTGGKSRSRACRGCRPRIGNNVQGGARRKKPVPRFFRFIQSRTLRLRKGVCFAPTTPPWSNEFDV